MTGLSPARWRRNWNPAGIFPCHISPADTRTSNAGRGGANAEGNGNPSRCKSDRIQILTALFSHGDCLEDPATERIPVTIELRFSAEDLTRIDRSAKFEGLERAEFLQRAATVGVKEALRSSEIAQSFDG